MAYEPLLELTRGNLVESRHYGALAVADAEGRLLASVGDPTTVAFLRSSAKPFQAISLLESGAADAYGFTPREISVACASHVGAAIHLEAVRGMQAKVGLTENNLGCGAHWPDDAEEFARLTRAHATPTPLYNNCSGKHTGMLAQAKHRGWPLENYLAIEHPLQQTILRDFAELCDVAPDEIQLGVDGCSAPNFAVPLVNAAMAFARLANPVGLPASRERALRAIFHAMNTEPEMVQGPGGFDTELTRAMPGALVIKRGAEGYTGVALAPGALGTGSPALGLVFKVMDGAARATPLITLEALRQLGVLPQSVWAHLAPFGLTLPQPQANWRGLEVGSARAAFELQRH
jgi:L-asparaginase II